MGGRQKKLVKEVITSFDPSQKQSGDYPTLFHELLGSDLPPQEKEFERLWQEGSALIGAGVETASNVLNVTLFYLCTDPRSLDRLRKELHNAMPDGKLASWQELETLEYLTAVINEGLRFAIGSSSRFIRVCPDQAVQYERWLFPAGTAISMSALLLHHHPLTFPNSETFAPERWLGKNSRSDLITFGRGPHMCAGIK